MVTWQIRNFKSLGLGELSLKKSHMTVVTGANSSGKSSLLQSLLLLAQSSYRLGPVILNGPLARLGDPSELIRSGAKALSISYSYPHRSRAEEAGEAVDTMTVELEPNARNDELVVTSLAITTEPRKLEDGESAGQEPWLVATSKRVAKSDRVGSASIIDSSSESTLLRLSKVASTRIPPRTYVAIEGIFPAAIVQHRNEDWIRREYAKGIRAALSGDELSIRFDRTVLVEFVDLLKRSILHSSGEVPAALLRIVSDQRVSPYRFVRYWGDLSSEQQATAIERAIHERGQTPWVMLSLDSGRFGASTAAYRSKATGLLEVRLEEDLADVVQPLSEMRRELLTTADRINYLGPLRDEPKVVWESWHERSQGLPVGLRGELSAGILALNGKQVITYTDPQRKRRSETLLEAVSVWTQYMGIGDQVSSRDLGKLGSGIELSLGGQSRDLTTVGVGVSQLLPVIVGLLSLQPRDVFMVEQPELHLHPAVQSRLADFFLFARPDVSVVVESHSEALLTRLRMRVACEELDPSKITILFVEGQEEAGARTKSLEIDQYGDLSKWPQGFFDNGQSDALLMLKANANRLRADASV